MKPGFSDQHLDGLPEISETSTAVNELSTALDTARTACSSTASIHDQMLESEKPQPKRSLSVILNEAAAELDRKIQRIRAQNPKLAEKDSNPYNFSESSLHRPRMFDDVGVLDKLPTQTTSRNDLQKPLQPVIQSEQDGLQPFTCEVPCSMTFDEHHSTSQDHTADGERSNFHSPDTLFYRYSPQAVIPMEEEALTLGQLQSADSLSMLDESARNMTSVPLTRRISLLKDSSDLSLGAQEPPVNPGIRVEIVESRRLPARRNGMVPDPFCSLSLHHYSGSYDGSAGQSQQVQVGSLGDIGMKAHLIRPQHRTRTVARSLKPAWSDVVTLDDAYSSCVEQEDGVQLERAFLTKLSWQPVLLVVTVHDDGVKSKEVLGQVVLRVGPGASLAQWFSLQRRDGLPQYNHEGEMAEILLRIRSFSRGLDGTRSATLERVRLSPALLNAARPDARRASAAVSSRQLPLVARLQALLRRTLVSRWYASMLVRFGGVFSRLPSSLEIQSDVRKPQALNDNYVETDLKLAAFWNARSPPPGFLPPGPGPSLHLPSLSIPASDPAAARAFAHSQAKPPLGIPRSPSPILPNGSLSPQPVLTVRSPSALGDLHPSALHRSPLLAEDDGEPEGSWWWDGEQPASPSVGHRTEAASDRRNGGDEAGAGEALGNMGVEERGGGGLRASGCWRPRRLWGWRQSWRGTGIGSRRGGTWKRAGGCWWACAARSATPRAASSSSPASPPSPPHTTPAPPPPSTPLPPRPSSPRSLRRTALSSSTRPPTPSRGLPPPRLARRLRGERTIRTPGGGLALHAPAPRQRAVQTASSRPCGTGGRAGGGGRRRRLGGGIAPSRTEVSAQSTSRRRCRRTRRRLRRGRACRGLEDQDG